jgi:hypothetical protein
LNSFAKSFARLVLPTPIGPSITIYRNIANSKDLLTKSRSFVNVTPIMMRNPKFETELEGNQVTRKSGSRKPEYLDIRKTEKIFKPDTPMS